MSLGLKDQNGRICKWCLIGQYLIRIVLWLLNPQRFFGGITNSYASRYLTKECKFGSANLCLHDLPK